MIERSSRYFDGPLYQAAHKYTGAYNIVVDRKVPKVISVKYFQYTWAYGDSLALISARYLRNPKFWWKIIEANPEILDPFSIEAGQVIRVPYGS